MHQFETEEAEHRYLYSHCDSNTFGFYQLKLRGRGIFTLFRPQLLVDITQQATCTVFGWVVCFLRNKNKSHNSDKETERRLPRGFTTTSRCLGQNPLDTPYKLPPPPAFRLPPSASEWQLAFGSLCLSLSDWAVLSHINTVSLCVSCSSLTAMMEASKSVLLGCRTVERCGCATKFGEHHLELVW